MKSPRLALPGVAPNERINRREKTSKKENPLLNAYGKMVCDYFSNKKRIENPISLFPSNNIEGFSDETPVSAPFVINPGLLEFLQRDVEDLRNRLNKELITEDTLTMQLDRFKKAVDSGGERQLEKEENEFYRIAKQAFQANIHGMKNTFIHMQHESIQRLPGVNIANAHQEIIKQSESGYLKGVRRKIKKTLNYNRSRIEKFFFTVSIIPATFGLKELFLNLNLLSGSRDEEIIRFFIALAGSLGLTVAVYDWRIRIMESVAEKGDSVSGIREAYSQSPAWMAIGSLLACVFGKMNYDGLVDLSFRNADIENRSQQVLSSLHILGEPSESLAHGPNSLYDLHEIIRQEVDRIVKEFHNIPETEKGKDGKKGPRYWAKFYTVHGKYNPKEKDVVRSFRNSFAARRMDQLLNSSSLDLQPSFSDKINTLLKTYTNKFQQTESAIHAQISILNEEKDYWERISQTMLSEDNKIPEVVHQIKQILNEHAVYYTEFIKDMEALIKQHSDLLNTIDPSLEKKEKITLHIPSIDSIKSAQSSVDSLVSQMDPVDLVTFLKNEHGEAFKNLILSIFFLLSLSLNFANPLYQLSGPARRGKEDEKFFPIMKKRIIQWENEFVAQVEVFFGQTQMQSILPGVFHPTKTAIRDVFYALLEEGYLGVRSKDHQSIIEKGNVWFDGLFKMPRSQNMKSAYARSQAIQKMMTQNELSITKMIDYFFPGIGDPSKINDSSFASIYDAIKSGQEHNNNEFEAILDKQNHETDFNVKDWTQSIRELNNGNSKKGRMLKNIAALDAKTSEDIFPTRTSWLTKMKDYKDSIVQNESLYEKFPEQIKQYMISIFPEMEQKWLIPLEEIYSRFPRHCDSLEIPNANKLRNQFESLQKIMLMVLGTLSYREGQAARLELYSDIDLGEFELQDIQLSLENESNNKEVCPDMCKAEIDKLKKQLESAYLEAKDIENSFREQLIALKRSFELFKDMDRTVFSSTLHEWEMRQRGQFKNFSPTLMSKSWKEASVIIEKYREMLDQIMKQPLTEKNFQSVIILKDEIDKYKEQFNVS